MDIRDNGIFGGVQRLRDESLPFDHDHRDGTYIGENNETQQRYLYDDGKRRSRW